jgi:transmembrane sensor
MLLVAGAVANAGESGVLVRNLPLMEVDDHLTWRSGYLTFRDTPLAAVIAEFNRYNERHIVIEDPGVAGIRISGKFRPNGFEAFVRLLEHGFAIQAQYGERRIILEDAHDAGGGEAPLE